MLRYDRASLYTRASKLFLFLESLFLFLAHRTIRSLIIYLGEREKMMSQRENLKEISGLVREGWEREEIEENQSLELILLRMHLEMGEYDIY